MDLRLLLNEGASSSSIPSHWIVVRDTINNSTELPLLLCQEGTIPDTSSDEDDCCAIDSDDGEYGNRDDGDDDNVFLEKRCGEQDSEGTASFEQLLEDIPFRMRYTKSHFTRLTASTLKLPQATVAARYGMQVGTFGSRWRMCHPNRPWPYRAWVRLHRNREGLLMSQRSGVRGLESAIDALNQREKYLLRPALMHLEVTPRRPYQRQRRRHRDMPSLDDFVSAPATHSQRKTPSPVDMPGSPEPLVSTTSAPAGQEQKKEQVDHDSLKTIVQSNLYCKPALIGLGNYEEPIIIP